MQHPLKNQISAGDQHKGAKHHADHFDAVHHFAEDSPDKSREEEVPPLVDSDSNRSDALVAQQVVTRPREWRPLYEIIEDGSVQSSLKNLPAEKSTAPTKAKILFISACMISALASSIASVAAYNLIMAAEPQPIVLHSPLQPPPTATPVPTATPAPITIFISGAVRTIGVYNLPVDSRIEDAIVRAGGLLPQADPERVNRAMKLFDGAQIHIPFRAVDSEQSRVLEIPPPTIGLSGGADAVAAAESASEATGKIDINRASQSAIETLPGIGTSKAQEIIAGRPYSSVDDLERISGIGAKTVDALREFITVE